MGVYIYQNPSTCTLKILLSMVVHVCNPSTLEVEAGGSRFKASLGYKVKHCLKT
jgi:hypothetical protein